LQPSNQKSYHQNLPNQKIVDFEKYTDESMSEGFNIVYETKIVRESMELSGSEVKDEIVTYLQFNEQILEAKSEDMGLD